MSSAIYLSFPVPIPVTTWHEFCDHEGIIYSPRTISRNVFYAGGYDGVEISFGKADYVACPLMATEMTVSTYFLADLRSVARVARHIVQQFGGQAEPDEELRGWQSWQT